MRRAMILGCMILSTAFAASGGALAADPVAPHQNNFHFSGTEDHVRIVSVARDSADQDQIIVTVLIDAGYHINANPASQKYLIATMLTFDGPQPKQVVYPAPTSFQPKFADEAIDVYQGNIEIIAKFQKGALSPAIRLRGTLLAQACTDQICLPPAEIAVAE